MIDHKIYDTAALLTVLRDDKTMDPPATYWLDMFGLQANFTTEFVDFNQIAGNRRIAPLVVPTAEGLPIYSAAERTTRIRPAYIKVKDPITATEMVTTKAGLGEVNSGRQLTPMQRYNQLVVEVVRQHREAITRRWEKMAADAVITGQNILEDDRYPRRVVDYRRDASHTVALTGAARWGEPGVDIESDLQTWITRMRNAKFGGPANRLTVGADVWEVMRQDTQLRETMNLDYKYNVNNGTEMNMGLRQGMDVERVGRLSGILDVYVYSDYYEDENGDPVNYMSPKDIVLTGPSMTGYRLFGAILDKGANFQALPIFPKMWNEEDPSATVIMHQSAPLMAPLKPNATFRATVVG